MVGLHGEEQRAATTILVPIVYLQQKSINTNKRHMNMMIPLAYPLTSTTWPHLADCNLISVPEPLVDSK